MNNALCRMTGAEFPLFAFSHCRDVVAAVSRAVVLEFKQDFAAAFDQFSQAVMAD